MIYPNYSSIVELDELLDLAKKAFKDFNKKKIGGEVKANKKDKSG